MALPSTGSISMAQVRTELGLSGAISLNQGNVRTLAGRPSGTISLSDLRGKSSVAAVSQNIDVIDTTIGQANQMFNHRVSAVFTNFTFLDGSKVSSISSATGSRAYVISGTSVYAETKPASDTITVNLVSSSGKSATVRIVASLGMFRVMYPAQPTTTQVLATVIA